MKKTKKNIVSSENKLGLLEKIKGMDKKILGIIGGAIVAVVVIVLVVLLICGRSNESKLESRMKELATSFYEDFYYVQSGSSDEDRQKFVSNYSATGIKVDLENLARYAGTTKDAQKTSEEIIKEFVNSKKDEACDKNATKATIYPQDPYGNKDYKIEITLSCGFESKK